MPEMHLRQLGCTYGACGPFTKNKERVKSFKEIGDSRYIDRSELDKACFQHDKAHGDFKDLNKVLHDQEFNIAKNPKYDRYQRGLASVVYKFFDKKTSDGVAMLALSETLAMQNKSAIKNEIISNN